MLDTWIQRNDKTLSSTGENHANALCNLKHFRLAIDFSYGDWGHYSNIAHFEKIWDWEQAL